MTLDTRTGFETAPGTASRVKPATLALLSMYDIENNATRVLAASARRAGHRVIEIFFKDWVNNDFIPPNPYELSALVSLLREHDVDMAAISVRASAYHKVASRLTRLIRDQVDVPVMWGGTHAILVPEKCIEVADAVCVGEGDITIVDSLTAIAEGRDLAGLKNLWVRDGGSIIRNPVENLVQNLDTLPFRDYTSADKFWIQGRKVRQGDPMVGDPVFPIMCSRGCVFKCSYCYNSQFATDVYKGKGKYYRTRSVSDVIDEINRNRAVFPNMMKVKFDDEVFPLAKGWVEEFIDRYPREVGLPFEAFIEPKLVETDLFTRLRGAGLEVIYMGVQNTHRVNAEIYDRYVPESKIVESVQLFHDIGIDYRLQVIVDDPMSSSEDKQYLFDFLLSLPRPFELYLFSMVVFPNTSLARKLISSGLITEKEVEGEITKTFQQMRVSLNWPRKPEDTFWCCMLVLLTKPFLPKPFLRWLSRNAWLKANPRPLVWFAQAANVVKMAGVCLRMLKKGELTYTLVRRWANPNSMISQ